jgi:hypothetical protein
MVCESARGDILEESRGGIAHDGDVVRARGQGAMHPCHGDAGQSRRESQGRMRQSGFEKGYIDPSLGQQHRRGGPGGATADDHHSVVSL